MAEPKKKWVTFRTHAKIPAKVIGEKEDKEVSVGEPVQVPTAYAKHVTDDRFADYCDPPKKAASPKKASTKKAEPAANKPDPKAAKALADAQAQVDKLTGEMEAMNAGDQGYEALKGKLDEATEALAKLKG